MKITYATNFLRVFKLPDEYPEGYCFGNVEYPVVFKIVDWFNAVSTVDTVVEQSKAEHEEWVETIRNFIKGKKYFNPNFTYMVMTDYGDVFIVNPEKRADGLQKEIDDVIAKAKRQANK